MTRRPWHGLALSLALHVSGLALVLVAISRDEMLPALMIDLRDPFVPAAASGASPPREERPARSRAAPSRRSRTTGERASIAAATPAPSAPSAPAAPALPPATVVEAPPSPPAPISEPPRALAPPAPPPSLEIVGPSAGSEPPGQARGGEGAVASGGGGAGVTGERASRDGAPTAADRGASGRGDGGDSAAPRVASVPPGGAGSGAGAEYGPYLTSLRERIQRSVRYPASARRRGLGGTVSVEILILANGAIGDVTLLESSTHAVLDDAALDTIRSLPRMPLPPELPAHPLRVRVPVVFQLR
jgi:protein TonB